MSASDKTWSVYKTCPQCKQELSHRAFYPSWENPDGLDTLCKECRNEERQRAYMAAREVRQ